MSKQKNGDSSSVFLCIQIFKDRVFYLNKDNELINGQNNSVIS